MKKLMVVLVFMTMFSWGVALKGRAVRAASDGVGLSAQDALPHILWYAQEDGDDESSNEDEEDFEYA